MQNVVQRRLGRVDGVGEVQTWGTDSKDIYVGFSRDALMQHRISSWELLQR